MSSLILSRRDIDFMLYEWLNAESLVTLPRYADHSRETFDAVLDLSAQMATEHFASHNKKNDANEPWFDGETVHMIPEVKAALDIFAEAGLIAAGQDYDLGGMQLPTLVEKACFAWFLAANVGTAAYPFLTIGNANLLLSYGTTEQQKTWVQPMMDGRFFGTMCLSEPQAGSSLADISTRAEPDGQERYRLFGNKMWISGGEHGLSDNIVHLVLARLPDAPPGVKGISLFIVPRHLLNDDGSVGEHNDVVLAGLNHKMGYRGTTNTLLNFGEGKFLPDGKPGAVGYLVGEPHKGLSCMFHMMNEARIGVGLGAAALGYTGYLHALDYARQRKQGRAPGAKEPSLPAIAIIEHTDVKRMLLAQKAYVEGGLGLNLYCARLVDEERTSTGDDKARATLLLDMLTPVAKSWPSQWCLEANNLAIQVHGGYGYTRDYNVEQFYRDNRLNPIHEGTHGIQALDLLGRKVVMQDGLGLDVLLNLIQASTAQAAELPELAEAGAQLDAVVYRLADVTRKLHGSGQPALALANAAVYLEAFGHTVVAWIWLEQMLAAAGKAGDFYAGKQQAGQWFFAWELPKTEQWLDLLASLDDTCLTMRDNWF
ncbi:MAG: acyl-CoA dehydrogenase [Gammaproteobacteria bacterium]|nr:acyl-CoA dehydrogenase [Gammaproteobacteria bacterium]|tara:strand:+ start:737 stop:2527 length:1791 start_codon:yes stop_codon:yes gene_type:complete